MDYFVPHLNALWSLTPLRTSFDQTNLYPLGFHLGSLWLSLTTLIILGPASNLLAPLKCLWTKENLYRGLLFMSQKFSWATTPISKWECYDFYAHIQVCFEKLQEVVWIKPITWQLSTYSATLLWHKQRTKGVFIYEKLVMSWKYFHLFCWLVTEFFLMPLFIILNHI